MSLVKYPNKKYVVFAEKSKDGSYMPSHFGFDDPIETYSDIANLNYEYGLESLGNVVHYRDFNSVLHYIASAQGYLFQRGVPEWSKYEDYAKGSVVSYEGKIYVAVSAQAGKPTPKPILDECGRFAGYEEDCECDCDCEDEDDLSPKNNTDDWEQLVTKSYVDAKTAALEKRLKALEKSIKDISDHKVVTEDDGEYVFHNLDGTDLHMSKPDVELTDASGDVTGGYMYSKKAAKVK